MTTENTAPETTTEAEKTPLTLDERIAQAKQRLAKLEQQKLTESLLENIEKGDSVTVKFGRADKVRHITGEVVGVSLPNIVVLSGDLETVKVHVRDVIENPDAAARTDNTPVVDVEEIDPTTGRRPEEAGSDETVASQLGAGEDPLENA